MITRSWVRAGNTWRSRAIAGALALCVLVLSATPGRTLAGSTAERIQRIRDGLLPVVLVKGETPQMDTLETRMRALRVPGVSIAVIHGGKLEWARGFGVTRIGGAPVTAKTLFQAASITKPVTTLAVLRLVQSGKLDLDADVNRYLRSWKVPVNEFTEQTPVTLRGLLTHSAGVSVHGFRGYPTGTPVPTLVQILDGAPPANNEPIRVNMLPGKTWRYSGGGFVIAQQVLNDVTAVPFTRLMQESVLRPLGMQHSTYEQPLPPKLRARAAWSYCQDGTEAPGGPQMYPELGAAGLWTTPSDLARFAIDIQQTLAGRSRHVLRTAMAQEMLRPEYNEQALGLIVGGTGTHKFFNHGGSNFGYRAFLVAYQQGDGAVIMVNSDNGAALISQLLRTIAHEYAWPDYAPPERVMAATDPKLFDRYVGTYKFDSGEIAIFWRDESHLKARIWGQAADEIFPSSDSEYFYKTVDARWAFSLEGSGSVVLDQNEQRQRLRRLDDADGRAAVEMSIAVEKRFEQQTPAAGAEAALRRLIAGLASGQPDYDEIRPAFATVIRQQLSDLQKSLARLGPLQSATFKTTGRAGDDTYVVKFESGERVFHIMLEPDGHVRAIQFDP